MVKKSISTVIYLAAWLCVVVAVASASVESRKLMEFASVGWEDEMARLDYLDSTLRDEPDSIAYIIVYGGRRGDRQGENQARVACIKDYMLERRGVSTERVEVIDGGYREKATIELWLVPRGESAPTATPTVSSEDVRFRKGRIKDWRCRCNI